MEACTIEVHFTNGEKKEIPGVLEYGYRKAGEGSYCFYASKGNEHVVFFPAENVNAFGKAGDFRVKG